MNISGPTVLHNGYPYVLNIPNFCELSLYARKSINPNGQFPIQINDGLDEGTFSFLVNFINDPNVDHISPMEAPSLLGAAISFDIPLLLEKIQLTLCNPKLTDIGIQCLIYASYVKKVLKVFERFVAYNFQIYVRNPKFIDVPCFVLYRIITWYNQTFSVTNEILEFYFSILRRRGTVATPLFLTLPYDSLPPNVLVSILEMPEVDFDTVGGIIMDHLKKTEEDKENLQECISQKEGLVECSTIDLERVQNDLDRDPEQEDGDAGDAQREGEVHQREARRPQGDGGDAKRHNCSQAAAY